MEPSEEPDQSQPSRRREVAPLEEPQARPTPRREEAAPREELQVAQSTPRREEVARWEEQTQARPTPPREVVRQIGNQQRRPRHPQLCRQPRAPIITYLEPPKPIIVAASDFKDVVLKLTGYFPSSSSSSSSSFATAASSSYAAATSSSASSLHSHESRRAPGTDDRSNIGVMRPIHRGKRPMVSQPAFFTAPSASPQISPNLSAPTSFDQNIFNIPSPMSGSNTDATTITARTNRKRSITDHIGGSDFLPSPDSNLFSTSMITPNLSNSPYFLQVPPNTLTSIGNPRSRFLPGTRPNLSSSPTLDQNVLVDPHDLNPTFPSNTGTITLTTTTVTSIFSTLNNNNIQGSSLLPNQPPNLLLPSMDQNMPNFQHDSNFMFASNMAAITSTSMLSPNLPNLPYFPHDTPNTMRSTENRSGFLPGPPNLPFLDQDVPNSLHDLSPMFPSTTATITMSTTTTSEFHINNNNIQDSSFFASLPPNILLSSMDQNMPDFQHDANSLFDSNTAGVISSTTTWINSNNMNFLPIPDSNLFSTSTISPNISNSPSTFIQNTPYFLHDTPNTTRSSEDSSSSSVLLGPPPNFFSPSLDQNVSNSLHDPDPMFPSNTGITILTSTTTATAMLNVSNNSIIEVGNFLPSQPPNRFFTSLDQNMPNFLYEPNSMFDRNTAGTTSSTTWTNSNSPASDLSLPTFNQNMPNYKFKINDNNAPNDPNPKFLTSTDWSFPTSPDLLWPSDEQNMPIVSQHEPTPVFPSDTGATTTAITTNDSRSPVLSPISNLLSTPIAPSPPGGIWDFPEFLLDYPDEPPDANKDA